MAFARLGFRPGVHRSHNDEIVHDLTGTIASHKKLFFSPFALGKFDAWRMPRSESA
jgi:hypothetical protein